MRSLVQELAQIAQILDLFFPDSGFNVYAGELEVRPPPAPTTPGVGAAKSKYKNVRYYGIHEHDQLNEAQMATAVRLAGMARVCWGTATRLQPRRGRGCGAPHGPRRAPSPAARESS